MSAAEGFRERAGLVPCQHPSQRLVLNVSYYGGRRREDRQVLWHGNYRCLDCGALVERRWWEFEEP